MSTKKSDINKIFLYKNYAYELIDGVPGDKSFIIIYKSTQPNVLTRQYEFEVENNHDNLHTIAQNEIDQDINNV